MRAGYPAAALLAGARDARVPPARARGEDPPERSAEPAAEAASDGRERPEGMLAFLNACQTAEAGSTESFLDVLHSFGFTGAIATERQTIDNFANEFGLAFLRGFLREGKPLGELLHSLRLERAPLGLLYGAHCPPEIRVKRADEVDGPGAPRRSGKSGGSPGSASVQQSSRSRARTSTTTCQSPRRALPLAGLLRRAGPRPVHRPRRRRRAVRRDAGPPRHADPGPPRRERHRQDVVPPRRGHPLPGGGVRRLPVLPPARRRSADRPGRQGPGRPVDPGPARRHDDAAALRHAGRRAAHGQPPPRCSTRPSGRRPITPRSARRCGATRTCWRTSWRGWRAGCRTPWSWYSTRPRRSSRWPGPPRRSPATSTRCGCSSAWST